MTSFREGTVDANGLMVHYYRTGDGQKPSLLFLHGLTDNGLCWTPVARDLATTYDVVMTDACGHGLTGGSVEHFSISTLADDAAMVIRALNLEKPVVWGHSMGAITAAVLAATYPDMVQAVILEDPPLLGGGTRRVFDETQTQQAVQELLVFTALSAAQRLEKAREMHPGWAEAELEPWAESKTQFNSDVWQKIYAYTGMPWREVIAQISCPLLLLTGDPIKGALVTPERAAEAQSLWKVGELASITGAGHNVHRDCYTEVMEIVRSFLSRHTYKIPSSVPHLTPIPLAEMSERTRELISRAKLDKDGELLAIFGTIARHPKLFASWLPFASRLMAGGSLDRRLTELVILRVAWNMGSDYEWGQHVEICTSFGIDRPTIERVIAGSQASGWSPLEALLLRATDELHTQRCITASTWGELSKQIDEMQLIELCFLVGHYEMLAMFLQTVGVQLESGKERLPCYDTAERKTL